MLRQLFDTNFPLSPILTLLGEYYLVNFFQTLSTTTCTLFFLQESFLVESSAEDGASLSYILQALILLTTLLGLEPLTLELFLSSDVWI